MPMRAWRPPGRGAVKTALRTDAARSKIYEFIRSECAAGRQAYVIYPVIDESERADLKATILMTAIGAVFGAEALIRWQNQLLGEMRRRADAATRRTGASWPSRNAPISRAKRRTSSSGRGP